jgi:hypothetical protein
MDRTTTLSGNLAAGGNAVDAVNAKMESAALAAHNTTDKIADKAVAQVDRLSRTAHRAVDGTADAAKSAARWASTIPEQAKQAQAQFTEAASASIRARPIATVTGALVVGYLLGRLARL